MNKQELLQDLSTHLAFMLLGYSFVGSEREPLTGWLYVFGFFLMGIAYLAVRVNRSYISQP